jgi:hypothetical protein
MSFFNKTEKSILIYNPLSKIGHFDSWCYIFTRALLEKGWQVCVISNDRNKLTELSSEFNTIDAHKLLILNETSIIRNNVYFSICRKILHKFQIFEYIKQAKINIDHSRLNSKLIIFARIHNFFVRKLEMILNKLFKPKLLISATNPIYFVNDINLALKNLGSLPNVVMNMYVDLYQTDIDIWERFAKKMKCKWVAIHMDMTHTLVNRPYSKSSNLKAIYTINESQSVSLIKEKEEVNYQWLPDVTDTSMPQKPSETSLKILDCAQGRKIVFLGGAIGGTKNLSLWSELIFRADPSKWFFVQIGKIDFGTLSSEDQNGLSQLISTKKENYYFSDSYLPDESVFNEVISKSDIIWGVYRDFDRSSNILTKAAEFKKPIIVSKKYLMGERVKRFEIGVLVSETEVNEALEALEWLSTNPIATENFEKYSAVYSTKALAQKLDQSLLSLI